MTKQEFIDAHKHELLGMLLDATVDRSRGAELSIRLTQHQQRLVAVLGSMYDKLMGDPIKPKDEKVLPPKGVRQ